MLSDVSTKLLAQFVNNLEVAVLAAEEPAPTASPVAPTRSIVDGPARPAPVDSPEPPAVDLLTAAGPAVFKRFAPAVIAGVVAAILLTAFRRRHGPRRR